MALEPAYSTGPAAARRGKGAYCGHAGGPMEDPNLTGLAAVIVGFGFRS